jgi:hypothetical protein
LRDDCDKPSGGAERFDVNQIGVRVWPLWFHADGVPAGQLIKRFAKRRSAKKRSAELRARMKDLPGNGAYIIGNVALENW